MKCKVSVYDIIVAMYHNQGHIPLKISGFKYVKYDLQKDKYELASGINCTIGLTISRTSVDHEMAFGKAGEGRVNEESMMDVIFAGAETARNRRIHSIIDDDSSLLGEDKQGATLGE